MTNLKKGSKLRGKKGVKWIRRWGQYENERGGGEGAKEKQYL